MNTRHCRVIHHEPRRAAAASAGGVWLVAWPRWDAEIGLTGGTALLWSAVLVVDAILILGTTLSTLWVRRAHA